MSAFWHDVRYSVRTLLRSPGFTAVAVLTLAAGIGANTAMFTVVNAVLMRPLPYRDSSRLAIIWENNPARGWKRVGPSGPVFFDWKEQSRSFEDMALFEPGSATITGLGEPEQVPGMRATVNLFELLGAKPLLGRLFLPEEAQGGRRSVAVLGYGYWQRRFGSNPQVIGQKFIGDGIPYTVIGVLPRDFWFPLGADVVVPWPDEELRGRRRTDRDFGVLGRLKPGITVEQASAELNAIARRLGRTYAEAKGWGVTVVPMQQALVEYIRPALLILLGAVGLVLLIGCVNLANLLLARANTRHREIAIRAAHGAGRRRIVQQLLTESVVLSLFGAALGMVVALWGMDLLRAAVPASIPLPDASAEVSLAQTSVDGRVLLFTLLLSVLTSLLFGLAPAFVASKVNLSDALKEGGVRVSSGWGHRRMRRLLVISEVALALVLVAGAALMLDSFRRLRQVNPGFNPAQVVTAELELPTDTKYRGRDEQAAIFRRFLERVQALPAVSSAALADIVPLAQKDSRATFMPEGRAPLAPGEQLGADYRRVSADYFRTLRIPLLKGRYFTAHDNRDGPAVAIIDAGLARSIWPEEDPVGRRLRVGDASREIVGVVGQVKHSGLDKETRPTIYVPYLQSPRNRMTIMARTAAPPASMGRAIKAAVWAVDKDQPVYSIRTMEDVVSETESAPRLTLVLLGVFGAGALALAALGIYGVISYSVSQRRQEVGIRVALGASRRDVLGMVMGEAVRMAVAGVAAGVAGGLVLTRVLSSLLYGVSATDPLIFAAVSVLTMLVTLAASYIPAHRASRVDPMTALHYE